MHVNDLNNTYVPCSQLLAILKLGSQQESDKSATVRKKEYVHASISNPGIMAYGSTPYVGMTPKKNTNTTCTHLYSLCTYSHTKVT